MDPCTTTTLLAPPSKRASIIRRATISTITPSPALSPAATPPVPPPPRAPENVSILFSTPSSRIITFSTPPNSSNNAWTSSSEHTISSGPLRIYKTVPHNIAFIQSGGVLKPILRTSRCWNVNAGNAFCLQIRKGFFWRVEILGGDGSEVEAFRRTLREVVAFETVKSPFRQRGEAVDERPEAVEPARVWRRVEVRKEGVEERDLRGLLRARTERPKTPRRRLDVGEMEKSMEKSVAGGSVGRMKERFEKENMKVKSLAVDVMEVVTKEEAAREKEKEEDEMSATEEMLLFYDEPQKETDTVSVSDTNDSSSIPYIPIISNTTPKHLDLDLPLPHTPISGSWHDITPPDTPTLLSALSASTPEKKPEKVAIPSIFTPRHTRNRSLTLPTTSWRPSTPSFLLPSPPTALSYATNIVVKPSSYLVGLMVNIAGQLASRAVTGAVYKREKRVRDSGCVVVPGGWEDAWSEEEVEVDVEGEGFEEDVREAVDDFGMPVGAGKGVRVRDWGVE